MIGRIPTPPPPDPPPDETGVIAVVLVPSSFFFCSVLADGLPVFWSAAPVGEVAVASLLDPPLLCPEELLPVAEGTFGRYSWPEGSA